MAESLWCPPDTITTLLISCVHVQLLSHVQLFATLWTVPARLLCPRDFPGKNTRMGCHFLLQGMFLTEGLTPHLLHQQAGSSPAEPPGKPTDGLA